MSKGSTLYRFTMTLSDVDRSVYETIDFRAALHPSETEIFLVTRALAFALCFEDGLDFSPGGLSSPDDPAIRKLGANGAIEKWIEIGNPAPRRLHKASKAAKTVRIYTYKDPENLKREAAGEEIHRKDEIEVFSFEPRFLESLVAVLARNNEWTVIHNERELVVTVGEETFMTVIGKHRLGK